MLNIARQDNTIVRVDRQTEITYPQGCVELIPGSMCRRPSCYDLARDVLLSTSFHQRAISESCRTIFGRLMYDGKLPYCLNLKDGKEIQKKDPRVFRRLYAGKKVFLWGSAVKKERDHDSVPYLFEGQSSVMLEWYSMDCGIGRDCPALLFRKGLLVPNL